MNKNVLITNQLLCDIMLLLHYLQYETLSEHVNQLRNNVDFAVAQKLDRMKRHDAFSAYKSTKPGPQRELLRQEYLSLAGIRNSFTSKQEIQDESL